MSELATERTRLTDAGELVASPTDPAERGPRVAIADDDPDALAAWLARDRIITAPRGKLLRLSLHYYTNRADLDAVVEGIRRYRKEHPGQDAGR